MIIPQCATHSVRVNSTNSPAMSVFCIQSGMNFTQFRESLQLAEPPAAMPDLLAALWWDARGDWHRAHTLAQDVESPDGAWVHAYLHRREGDPANARYWYRRAGRQPGREALDQERDAIVQELLANLAAQEKAAPKGG